ncbi:hypothetical protein [Streptomyces sp. NPDC088182]|uniref:hypothetical protein n=1 Tax=Streptomyces sp. NPDC088182 TaxID=3365838 RepID=UPI003821EB7D
MTYALIATGELAFVEGKPDFEALLGPEGHARVRLHPSFAMAGWVNDCGLMRPERYPRAVVGSCVLAAYGAAIQPYAGAVVITGWDASNTARGLPEICSLPIPEASLMSVHADVRRALAASQTQDLSPSWAVQIREIAEYVRTAPTPGLTITAVHIPRDGTS